MNTELKEITNEATTNKTNMTKGRKLTAKPSTFYLDEGTYKGTITGARWYKNEKNQDKVMLIFELEDGTMFKTSVPELIINDYPYTVLTSQTNSEYVEEFIGHKVKFTIRHNEKDGMTYSNIKRIELDV